jgi:hypothetical protein
VIDPAKHLKQLHAVGDRAKEYPCPSCGRRTTDAQGACINCRRLKNPSIDRMTIPQLAKLMDACRVEIKKRRDEAAKALEGVE